jgi:hypothetical protein
VEEQVPHTLAQALFPLTAFFVAPAFGLVGLLLGAPWIRPLARVLVPLLGVIMGLSFAGAAGMLAFPEYPYIGPPERFAAALVIPGHLVGALALGWLIRSRRPSEEPPPRAFWIASGVVWLVATFVAVSLAFATAMPPRLALPDEATRVVERRQGELMLSDYSYWLEADMSPEAYARYVERLQLPAAGGTTHELVDGACGMRTRHDGERMYLEAWCE